MKTQYVNNILVGPSEITAAGNLVLSSSGRLVDATSLTLTANLGTSGAPCLDEPNHRAYLATGTQLAAFDTTTLLPLAFFPLPSDLAFSAPQSCIRWGLDGFALNADNGMVYLGRWSAIPVNPDSNADGMADDWELHYFGTLQVSPAQDQDLDGIPNAMEYLFGTSPIAPSPNPIQLSVVTAGGESEFRLVFPRRPGLSPLPYTYQTSANLTDWSTATGLFETVLGTATLDGLQVETIEVLLPLPNPTSAFLRFLWK